MEKWQVTHSNRLIANQWIGLRADDCLTTRGARVGCYYVVEKRDFVMAVAITAQGELLLARQYKHGCGEVTVECPAGHVEAGEHPAAAVVRELREETGYRATDVRKLATWYASPAVMNNNAHLFLCTGAQREGDQELDRTEDIELVLVGFWEAVQRVQGGGLVSDLASVAAILQAARVLAETAPTGLPGCVRE